MKCLNLILSVTYFMLRLLSMLWRLRFGAAAFCFYLIYINNIKKNRSKRYTYGFFLLNLHAINSKVIYVIICCR